MPTQSRTRERDVLCSQRRLLCTRGIALVLGGPLLVPRVAATPSDAEARLIEAVIQSIATMSGTVFIRNGATATAAEASKHLRDKYAYYRSEIATAEDFIRLCGTRSALSGRAYLVRLPNGVEQPAADVLSDILAKLRLPSSPR